MTIWQLLKSWCVSYIGNLAGALFLSYVIMNSGLLEAEPWLTFVKTATYNKVNLPFLQVLTRYAAMASSLSTRAHFFLQPAVSSVTGLCASLSGIPMVQTTSRAR